jgi:hypothetical protein
MFMDFVVENKFFHLLDRRANTPAVKTWVEEHKELPPGCNLTSVQTLGVRAPTK